MEKLSKLLPAVGAVPLREGDPGKSAHSVVRVPDCVSQCGRVIRADRKNPRLVWRGFLCPRCCCLMRAGFYCDQRYAVHRVCRCCRAHWYLWRNGEMSRDREGERAARGVKGEAEWKRDKQRREG